MHFYKPRHSTHVAITLDIKVTGQSYNIYISKSHPKLDTSRDVMLFSSLLLSGIGIIIFFSGALKQWCMW